MGYIRFVVPRRNEDSHRRAGVFTAALRHKRSPDLDPSLRARLASLLDWFADHLHAPSLEEPRAVFWFHGRRNACTRRIWELAWLLYELGEHPRLLKARRPGYVVYRDRHQVAAMPFRDLEC